MPDKYYIDGNQELRVVPEGKEKIFLSKYPGSREATSKELSDFESKRAKMQTSTQRESNIQNRKDSSTAIIPANTTLGSDNTSIYPNQPNIGVTNYAEEFAKNNKPQLSLKQEDNTPTKIFSEGSPFSQPKDGVISDAMKKVQNKRAQESDQIVESAIDEYDSYKNWIDQVNADPEMSDSIKKNLNDWYTQNYKDANNATDNIRIPNLVRDYLEKNKKPVSKSVYIPGSSMFGGGSFVEGTVQENTPEQMAMIADFLVNSPKGRLIMEDEKLYLKRLDENIDDLEKNINNTTKARNESLPKTIGMRDYLTMPKWEKDKFNKDRESIRSNIEKEYPISDIINSQNQLNELKKLREAYNDGDRGAIKQLLKEFGRRLPYDLANAASLGTIGLTEESSLSSVLNDPKNVLTRKGYNLVKEYQQAHEIDRSIAQDIARGTTQTLPFITQFIATGGVTSSLGKGLLSGASKIGLNAEKIANIGSGLDKTSKIGKGLSVIGNGGRIIATDALDAGARSLIMPNTYADAYARSIDNPGSYLDNFTHSWFVNTIENYSEKFGAHLPGIGIKNPKLKMIMDQTGIQGFPEEFAEEQLSTILNSAFDTGQADWSDLVDPRNQLITAGTIGLLQVPYASVSAGGYAAGKYRDITQKRSIRKGYNSNLSNMNNVFGKESEGLINTINQIIDSDNSEGLGINSFISNVSNDAELTDKEKDAVFKYAMSYVPYSALNQAKQEAVSQVEQQVTHAVEANSNPEMSAIVSAKLSGVENPMHVVSGNIVQREDGSIDREASDKQIFYVDAEGNKQVTSIDFIENIEESIPTQDAIAQLTESEIANIISQQENEEVREYIPGEIVTADIYGNGIPFTGQITEVTEAGNYIIVGTQSGQRAEIQPRQIINQDNIQGVDNGSLVQYRNEKGEIAQGTVNDAYGLRPHGMMDIDGNVIPIANIIGLVEEEDQQLSPTADMMIGNNGTIPYNPNISNSQDQTQVVGQNEQSVTTSPSEQNNLSYFEQIPQNESGSLLFEQVPVETTIGALNEVYSDAAELSGVVDATISNIGKQIDKAKSPKPTGDITKDIANKQKANQQIEELNNRLSYWQDVRNAIQESKPIEQRVSELLMGEETPIINKELLDTESAPLSESEQWEKDNFTDKEIEKRREFGLTPDSEYQTTYRGVSQEEWSAIQNGDTFSSEGLNKGLAYVTPDRKVAEQTGKGTKADLVIEFHPESRTKMRDGDSKLGSVEYYGEGLNIEDVSKVYDSEGNVVYDSSAKQEVIEESKPITSTSVKEQIAQAEAETDTNPTEAQKEAGNYKKGKVTIQGFDISIEQPQGSVRSGVDANGKEWSITMNNTYGYIRGTEGKDGDHIDVFLGNNPESNRVFVVDQVNQDGSFDEHKVMLGFNDINEARESYLSNYEEGWLGLGNITDVDVDIFRKWTDSETRRIKPFVEYKEIQETLSEAGIPISDNITVQQAETTTSSNDVRIVEYSDKSIAVYGNTKEIKDQLKAIGGRFNPKLKDGAGWIFPKNKESDVRTLLEEQSTIPTISETEAFSPAYGASNTLISTEKYEELRKQMRSKLNNLNSGFDPELFTIGTQMAMYHIEAGARKFADFANRMIEDLGDNVRPYLKSFYEGARQMPSMETMRSEMDAYNAVDSFNLDNLSTFENEITKPNSNETNSDNRSDNSIAENGGISTRATGADVRERTASTQTDGRTQSEQRPAMETESVEQRGRSDRDRGNNAESSGTELYSRRTESNADNRRKDTGDTEQSGKPLNINNNRQSRGENVVPRGNTAKINANIAAIKLAKRLIETGKKATPEQMNVLRRYTGWGGLSSVFQQKDKNYKTLQDLLTEEEYDSARASTTTAFYTPSEVTASVWDMIEKLGFNGGNILEPSAGIGNFFALMPENISNVSRLRGVELDTVSGSILKLLYPDANINISGFEKQRIANNSMDLVVSNVPFGNFKVYDSNNKDISTQFDIHDYFIAKSVRTLKAGGIGVFITTSSTLDKSSALRNWLINNGNADFIDAVRLNTDTFKNDAGTEATADIIIVRKRDVNGISQYAKNMQDSVMEREATYNQQEKNQWGYNTGEVEKKARMVYNKYFLDNPTRMAGEMKFGFEGGNAIRPTEQRLAPVKDINQQDVINQMIDELPSNIYNTTPADKTSKAVANNGTKEGGLTIIDGQPYIVQYNEAVPVDWNSNKAAGYAKEEVLQDYLDIKNTISELLEAESSTDNELVYINKIRTKLNKVYDNFVRKYGNLNENRKINFLEDDIDFPSVAAIENIEDGKNGEKTISKSDIFTKRVIDNQIEPKADNVEDGVRVSMNQNGKVDIPYIAQLLDKTNEEVQSEIVSKRIGFVNPETGLVEARNQYLSGNVRDKLSIAQQANQENEYDSNIEELSKVIPADIPINLIKLTLGSTWVPTSVYEDFFKETFDVGAQFTKTSTDKYIGKFSRKDNAKDIQMGMPEASGSTLALNSMNNATTTISMQVWEDGKRKSVTDPLKTAQAAAKQSEIAETFEAWVKQNKKYHEELENIYNNTFNSVVNSTVDVDSFDRFPGVGGKVVSLGSKELNNGKELHQYRVAKENTEADNELVAKEAKSLGLDYNAETGVYSTINRGNADRFAKKLNGTAKILRQHQKEGVIRGLESATLLAHEVGTGKTLTLITTAMEMRRLGLAKKPTIVVQRSTYKQFVKEIKNQYPNAKVLAPSAKDLTAKQRQQLFAKIAYNDWDIVVLYHSYLDSIPDNPQRVAQYIDEKIQEKMDLLAEMERAKEDGAANAGRMMGALKKEIERLERDRDNTLNPDIEEESDTPTKSKRKRSIKDIEKVRSNAESKAEKSLDRRTDNTMTFEQLGIDALLIDEAHAYKKLGFVTSLQRVKGIDTAESKRAQSTRLKSSYILENHNGKNIVLATGTPISNTMAEMWTFMRYLYPRTEMGRLQMNNFDAFVNNFGSIEESAEFGSNGKFRITNRFSSYSNVPELIAAWRQVAHTVLTEEVSTLKEGVGTPRVEGGKPSDIMLEQTPPLKSVMKAIKNKLEEFDRMSGAEKKENSYIPLVMFGLAKRAAIDVRLVDPDLPDHPDSKLNRTVAEVVQDLKDTQDYKGTIAIFCDSYQSSDKTFNVFRELKQKLVDNGIPAEQVAIINDFDKDEAKERLFTSVNNGDVRVVLGTTEKLGVGVNIQERLHMAVHMDAPLRPSDYQQRNGRIMRQGNTHLNMDKSIKILRIGVQKTLDVTGYQRLEIKKKFIDQIMKGDVSQRMLEEADIESTDSSNFNQMMANLSGSQAALALSIEQNKLKKLQNARQYHEDNQVYMAGAVRRAKGIIVGNGQAIERFEDYKKELNKLFPEGKVTTVSIGKVSANTPEDIDALLSKHITKRIDKEAADLREDFLRENAIIKTSMLVDGIKIDLEIEVKRNYDVQTNKTRVTREIHYTTPNNSIENPHSTKSEVIPLFESKAGANVQNVIDEINDLLSGYDIEREIQRYKIGIDKAQRDIDAYEPQIGQPFVKENELRATEERVEDLNAQMEVELKQIEEAESKEDVEAINIDGIVEKNTDDNPEDDPTPPSSGRRQTSSSGNFQSIPAEKFDRLVDKLTQTGLAVDVVLNEDIRNNPELQDAEGNVYGYVTPDGVVYLDATRMNANTPIHEFGHLWNSFTKENDTALYNRGVELIQQSLYWERVNNNTDYASLSEEQRTDEALAMAIGDKGEAITNRSLKQQFVDWLSEVWQSIKRVFGINTNASLADMTLSDFTDRAVQNLLRGERLTETTSLVEKLSKQEVSELEQIKQSSIDDGSFMKAPNGEPTNLTEKQWLQVRSSNFKKWFGDWENKPEEASKVVDKNGEPKIVYHATQSDFDSFNKTEFGKTIDKGMLGSGFYFTNDVDNVNLIANNLINNRGNIGNVSIIPTFLNIRNPYKANYFETSGDNIAESNKFTESKKEQGYDGSLFSFDNNFIWYNAFEANQIKSAISNIGDFNNNVDDIRLQSVNELADATNSTMSDDVRNQLDIRIKNFRFRIREAWEDRHLAVKEFLDILRKNGVEIPDYNDYYKQATHINGKIDAQLEHYNETYQKPLNKSISDIEREDIDYRSIENYAILKHGLERNEWMRQNAINQYKTNHPDATQEQIDKYTETLPDDYSGITAVQEEVGMSAEDFITEFENKAGKKLIDNFWKKVKDSTQYSISKQLEGGLIDKKTFDDLTGRYDYYIPLRGHDAETAEDRWDYSPNMGTYFVAPLIKAKGRKTRSESPFAYIFSMAQSSINSANRNWLNQTILRLARKDTTGLMSVSQSWYVMDGMNADGVPAYKVESPTFSENPEQYRQNIEEFEERMLKLAEQGFAYPSGSKLDIGGLFIKRNQADQHEIHVWQNGKEYTVYINANPAVARAINGVNAKDLHKDLRFIAKVSRQMAANFTTRNPIFVATNFSRDYIFASSILPVKEDTKYAIQFQRNMLKSSGALHRYIRGKADLTKQQDQYVIEYIMNGAKTGFSHIIELDKVQKRIEQEIKKGENKNVFRSFLDILEGCNEFAENLSRLSVYITSREQGRSITQSISDAKEVTVNFNRSGAGGYGAAWFRSLYLFVNAGIQALSNFAKVAQKNKGKTALLISGYAMTGFLMPMLTALIGGDDGLDEYMKLSDWERQNNLCIYTGNGFIKIPLPHELRVFHAMGDNIYQASFGRKDITQTILDVILSFSDLIPANPMGAIQGSWADIMPDATKPFFQLQANRSFTGSRIINEWADPNKPGYLRIRTNKKGEPYAPAFLVKLGQSLDDATGGDGVEKGLISFNPDEVNHILRGYFGGLYTIGTQVLTIGDKIYELTDTGEFKMKIRETPLKTFYTSSDDLLTTSSGLNSKYYKISDNAQEIRRKIKGYQEQALNGKLTTEEFAVKISKLSSDVEILNRIYPYMKQIKKYENALKDLEGEDQKDAEKIIANLKKEVIEINSMSK